MSEQNEKNNASSGTNSTEQNSQGNNSISGNDHPISAGLKFLTHLFDSPKRTKHSLQFGTTILVFIWLLVLTILVVMQPKKVSFGNLVLDAGSITLKDDDSTSKTLILNPNGGGYDNPWLDTQIDVKKGDNVKINASGKINLAVGRLISSAQDDTGLKTPWNDPDGISSIFGNDPDYPEIRKFKIMADKPLGMLIAGVQSKDGDKDKHAIGKSNDFIADKDGKIILTVNDIWLESKEAYLPPETNIDYYNNQVLSSISNDRSIAQQESSKWNQEKWKQERRKQYSKRYKQWNKIKEDKHYSLWYDDNIGAFAVTISIENVKK